MFTDGRIQIATPVPVGVNFLVGLIFHGSRQIFHNRENSTHENFPP